MRSERDGRAAPGDAAGTGSAGGVHTYTDQARLGLALEAGRMGTWEWNIAANTVDWSPQLQALHGLTPGSFDGTFEAFQQDIHPEERERVFALVTRTLETGADYQIEYRIVRPDGQIRWVEARGRLFRDADGAPARMVGICMDISDRKRAEQQQKLLMDELNHRVKNTLAIVQSMADQTLRELGDPASFRTAFTARLSALARAHSVLTRQIWQGAQLTDVAFAALAPFGAAEDGQGVVAHAGPAITIRPNVAVALSLVLHEMATNAAKHGALSAERGRVRLSWDVDGQPPWVGLSWIEEGGPPVAAPTRRGFGSRLLEASASQLGGTSQVDFDRAGVRILLRFPLEF